MTKSILVIDTPKTCAECQFNRLEDLYYCTLTRHIIDRCARNYCPLKPMPNKRLLNTVPSTTFINGKPVDSYALGWNECINEILGGNNE